jgi:hypothetical protein
MSKIDITTLDDTAKAQLVENRWDSSKELWEIVEQTYKQNTAIYANKADWLQHIPAPRLKYTVQANRIFVNMESVINSLIANPPGVNILPSRDGETAQEFARKLESFFRKKYLDLNVKETTRMAYRNLYFARLMVIKAFWNPIINDFDYRAVDPRKVRVAKYARKEQDSEFAIEEIKDNLCAVIERFPKKKDELMERYGFVGDEGEKNLYIKNPDVKYKEAWINNEYVIFKLDTIILDTIKNPYWDWDGILITEEEESQLTGDKGLEGDARRQLLQRAKLEQDQRKVAASPNVESVEGEQPPIAPAEGEPTSLSQDQKYKSYYFNYFDNPRKPYIIATIFNNENTPIGRTDMITLSAQLQKGIDKRKMDIDENCELVNGIVKVDASVMGKSDAQRIRWETRGIIWGKGVKDGVTRETANGLPQMVFDDMIDSRSEIDNIMAASSAFRGEREGQETKAGRLALIQQSYLRLNELIQVGDYVAKEIFDWGMQMAKTRYTEYHYAKWMGKEGAREVIELIQDDFETGSEVKIIAGKSLPVDDEFKFEQAQNDFEKGALGLTDYLERENYDNAKDLAKNAIAFKINPVVAVGLTPEEIAKLQPPQTEKKPPNVTINYADLPPDAQEQLLAQIEIKADPAILIAEKIAENESKKSEFGLKKQGQEHGQTMAEKSQSLAEIAAKNKGNEKAK